VFLGTSGTDTLKAGGVCPFCSHTPVHEHTHTYSSAHTHTHTHKHKHTRARLQYIFSRPYSKMALLSFLTVLLIVLGGVALYIVSDRDDGELATVSAAAPGATTGAKDRGSHIGEREREEPEEEEGGYDDGFAGPSLAEAMWAAAAGAGVWDERGVLMRDLCSIMCTLDSHRVEETEQNAGA